ncbi:hypothetical protein BRADI_3g33726v3 [Brachypodium distachyon]|uniref:Replication protein A 70 kDa DNA-binding subunit B/D first OB fold domain-containing protein n=1 Tax=Brachypodium distachyon TaxID=15368 RepID=A0A2K2D0W5_BRADI|nr:hypothetical protein BRADI_3g33726v3 [Brachypodium distachyon]
MSTVPYSLIRELNDDSQDWRVRVRVARLREQRDFTKDDELIRLHFVVVDEKAGGMHGFVPKGQIAKFKDVIKEGSVYDLQNFEVTLARDNYRAVDHNVIDPVPPEFPLHVYRLRTFQNIMESLHYLFRCYVDVLGIVTGVSELLSADVKGRVISRRIIRLTDTRHTAIVSLWGMNAERLDARAFVRLSEREPVVALIMGCTFRMQDGGSWVSFCVVSGFYGFIEHILLLLSFNSAMISLSASFGSKICINWLFGVDAGVIIEMVFFGQIAEELLGKPADILVADSYALEFGVPSEISSLVGRIYVVDLAISRYSFRRDNISFQALKFYPEGGMVFAQFVSGGADIGEISGSGSGVISDTVTNEGQSLFDCLLFTHFGYYCRSDLDDTGIGHTANTATVVSPVDIKVLFVTLFVFLRYAMFLFGCVVLLIFHLFYHGPSWMLHVCIGFFDGCSW